MSEPNGTPCDASTKRRTVTTKTTREKNIHGTHVRGESGLVTDGRGDTTEQGRHLRTGLGETEDVVDEEQHILAFLVTEVLRDGETGERDTGTGSWGLVHLAEHECDLGLALELDDTGLDHFVVQIVTLASTLSDTFKGRMSMRKVMPTPKLLTAENGDTTVGLGDVVDKFLDEHGLADTCTTEETNLATTSVGGEEVDDLDAGLEHLSGGGLVDECRRVGVDGRKLGALDRTTLVDGLANDVHDATEGGMADGNLDGRAGVHDFLPTDETLGSVHGNGADRVLTEMRGNLEDEAAALEVLDLEGVQDRREVLVLELDVDDGTNDSLDGAEVALGLSGVRAGWKTRQTIFARAASHCVLTGRRGDSLARRQRALGTDGASAADDGGGGGEEGRVGTTGLSRLARDGADTAGGVEHFCVCKWEELEFAAAGYIRLLFKRRDVLQQRRVVS